MRNQFVQHLAPFERGKVLSLWHEGMIVPGTQREDVTEEQLRDAHLVIALVSATFLANDRQRNYFSAALYRQEEGKCIAVAVLLSPCLWEYSFMNVPTIVLPRNKEEITEWKSRAKAYQQVIRELQEIIARVSRRFLS